MSCAASSAIRSTARIRRSKPVGSLGPRRYLTMVALIYRSRVRTSRPMLQALRVSDLKAIVTVAAVEPDTYFKSLYLNWRTPFLSPVKLLIFRLSREFFYLLA